MSAYHATHPSPYDDACPDCTGFADPEPDRTTRWGWAPLAILAVLILAAIAWRMSTHG